jgi:hypothetical protein
MGLILLPGTCSKCGCTDDNACEGGCSWVDPEHTLCSACADFGYADAGEGTVMLEPELGDLL